MNKLGKYIEQSLQEHNMSERELAARCGISHSYINQLIKGVNPKTNKPISPTISMLQKLSTGLGVSIDNLQNLISDSSQSKQVNFVEEFEKKGTKEGIPVGNNSDRIIPWELWNEIKSAQSFIECIGIDPSSYSQEDWEELLNDIRLVVKIHQAKNNK